MDHHPRLPGTRRRSGRRRPATSLKSRCRGSAPGLSGEVCGYGFDRSPGDYVVSGECVGWVARDDGDDARDEARSVAPALQVSWHRSIRSDVGFGLHLLVDIADRALSPAVNDPHTARQALEGMRTVLVVLAQAPLGDRAWVDPHARERVSLAGRTLRDLVSLCVDGPSRYGATDPDLLGSILELAQHLGLAAQCAEDRHLAREVVQRVVADAAHAGMDADRLAALRSEAEAVDRAILAGVDMGLPLPRLPWALVEQPA